MTLYEILTTDELAEGAQSGTSWFKRRIDYPWLFDFVSECDGDPWRIAEAKSKLDWGDRKRWDLEMYLGLMWAKPYGLRPTTARDKAARQIVGCQAPYLRLTGLFDHDYFFRSGQGPLRKDERLVIATHPYLVDQAYRDDAAELCKATGATVKYPNFPSWWNWHSVGRGTTLVVWSGAGADAEDD